MITANITIQLRDDGCSVSYSKAFQNATVIGMKLIKSGEWIYAIYRTDLDEELRGYIYEGNKLTFQQIAEILSKHTPPTLTDVNAFAKKYKGRISFHRTKTDSFQIIGTYSDREIIVKK